MNKYEPLIQAAFYNMMFVNDLAASLLIDADEQLRHSPQYKQNHKRQWRKVMDELRTYERAFNRRIGAQHGEFVANANDLFMEQISSPLTTLHYCVKQVFDSHKMEQSALYTSIEMARTLVHFCNAQFDNWRRQLIAIPTTYNIATTQRTVNGVKQYKTKLDYLRLTSLQTYIDRFCNDFYHAPRPIDLTAKIGRAHV